MSDSDAAQSQFDGQVVDTARSLGGQAINGAGWNLAAFGSTKLIGFATTLILARILAPEDFGLFSLAQSIVFGFNVLFGFGLHNVVVSNQGGSKRDDEVLLFVLLACSSLGTIVLIAMAPIMSIIFDEPRLTLMLALLSSTILITGGSWMYDGLLQRRLAFRARFVAQSVQISTYSVASLGLALGGAGVWSVIIALIGSAAAMTITLGRLARPGLRPAIDIRYSRVLIRRGRGYFAQTVGAYLQGNSGYLIVGSLLGTQALGLYGLAFRIAELPNASVAEPVGRATFPIYVRLARIGSAPVAQFTDVLRIVIGLTLLMGVIIGTAASPLVALLLGSEWGDMVPVLAVLGLWVPIRSTATTYTWFLNGSGHSGLVGAATLSLWPVLIAGLVVGGLVQGIRGVAVALVLHSTLEVVVLLAIARRRLALDFRRQLAPIGIFVPGAAAATVVGRWVTVSLDTSPALALVLVTTASSAAYASVTLLLARHEVMKAAVTIRSALGS